MFDSPIDRHRRTKKSLLPFWLLIVAILIAFGYYLCVTVGPNPPIVVSKATTHLTKPLGKDGVPDYAAVLLADAMTGVTPETNAAVPLVEALGYEGADWDTVPKEDHKLLYDASERRNSTMQKAVASPSTRESRRRQKATRRRRLKYYNSVAFQKLSSGA
jgi:hypothetical protein